MPERRPRRGTLTQQEVETCAKAGIDPSLCIGTYFPCSPNITIAFDPNSGAAILVVQVAIPPGLLRDFKPSKVLDRDGKPKPPDLQKAIAFPPSLRAVVRWGALSEAAQASLAEPEAPPIERED